MHHHAVGDNGGVAALPMQDPEAAEGISRFLRISLKAEAEFTGQGLFEDHIEPRLA